MDAGITAFPTFHFYLKSTRVNEIKGADITKITSAGKHSMYDDVI
jgi:hypothetical protein